MTRSPKIMISACELSADNYAGNLVKALLKQNPKCQIFGIGSRACKNAGMDVRLDISALSTVGIFESLRFLPQLYSSLTKIKALLREEKPDIFIPLDNQGLHIMCCKYAKKLQIRTAYYIAPQYWHWGKKEEGEALANYVDHIFAIFKKEATFYKDCGLDVTYVGHPILDRIKSYRALETTPQMLGVFPGSRLQEIERLSPVLIQAAEALALKYDLTPCISVASPIFEEKIKGFVNRYSRTKTFDFHYENSLELIAKSRLSLVSSGTVSFEHALMGVPHVVTYRFNPITFWVAQTFFKKTLAKIPFMSMPNSLLNTMVFPELLQDKLTLENCVNHGSQLLDKKSQIVANSCEKLWNDLHQEDVANKVATSILSHY